MINVVFFDVGGVLLTQDTTVFDAFDREHNLDLGTTRQEWSRWLRLAHSGTIQFPEEFDFPLLNEFRMRLYTTNQAIPGMHDIVECVARYFRIGIISNFTPDLGNVLEQIGFLRHFDIDNIVNSSTERVTKPAAAIYEIACKKLRVSPPQVLMIDDHPPNIEAARQFGMNALIFSSTERLVKELSDWGIPLAIPAKSNSVR